MRYILIIYLTFLSCQLTSGQTDSIKYKTVNYKVEKYCRFEKRGSKYYFRKIGATFNYVALANGWFKTSGSCSSKTYISEMIKTKFYLDKEYSYIKYKKGRLYSGRIKERDGEHVIIGRCKKGKLNGKVKVLDNLKNIVWQGIMKNGFLLLNE